MAHERGPWTVEHATGCDLYEAAAAGYDTAYKAMIDAASAVTAAVAAAQTADAEYEAARGKLRRFELTPGIPACLRRAAP